MRGVDVACVIVEGGGGLGSGDIEETVTIEIGGVGDGHEGRVDSGKALV